MKSMPRPNSGSKKTPKHLMRPGKNVFQQDVSTMSERMLHWFHRSSFFNIKIPRLHFSLFFLSTGQETVSKPQGKAELRKQYLLEKYVWKWKQFMRSRKGEGLFPRLLKLSHNNWLRQVKKKRQCFFLPFGLFYIPVNVAS